MRTEKQIKPRMLIIVSLFFFIISAAGASTRNCFCTIKKDTCCDIQDNFYKSEKKIKLNKISECCSKYKCNTNINNNTVLYHNKREHNRIHFYDLSQQIISLNNNSNNHNKRAGPAVFYSQLIITSPVFLINQNLRL